MNKVILGLILAVCILGMALVMLNERLGRKGDTMPPQLTSETRKNDTNPVVVVPSGDEEPVPAMPQPAQMAEAAINLENEEAREALAPPRELESVTPVLPKEQPIKTGIPESKKPEIQKPEPKPAKPEVVETRPRPEPKPEPKPEPRQETKPTPKVAETPAPRANKNITRFVIFSREKGATIRLAANQPMLHQVMNLENPDRVVLDIDGEWEFPANPGIPKNELVNNVRIGKSGDKTRVVIDLKSKPRTTRVIPSKKGDSIDIRVDK